MKSIRPKVDTAYCSLASAINALYQVNSLVTRSESTEAELGSLIDSVNGLIVQLHQTLSIRGAGSTSDVNTDDTVSPGGGDTSSGGSTDSGSGDSSDGGSSGGGGGTEME